MFKFPKGYPVWYKKYYQKYYPLYQNSQDFIKSLFFSMGKINDFYPFDIREADCCPVSLDTICMIVKDILKTEFDPSLAKKFTEMVNQNRIFFFDGNSDTLCEKYDEDFCCGKEDYIGRMTPIYPVEKTNDSFLGFIYAPLLEEVDDVWGLVHEMNHISCLDLLTERPSSSNLNDETLPIYSEFVTLNYFLEHFSNHNSYYYTLMDRYDTITDLDERLMEKNYDFSKCENEIEIFEEFIYLLGLLIASKLFYDYNQDPYQARGEYNFLINNLMECDFNCIMKEINIPIRLLNETLSFTKGGLETCLFYYEWALKYVHKNYMETQKRKNKRKK